MQHPELDLTLPTIEFTIPYRRKEPDLREALPETEAEAIPTDPRSEKKALRRAKRHGFLASLFPGKFWGFDREDPESPEDPDPADDPEPTPAASDPAEQPDAPMAEDAPETALPTDAAETTSPQDEPEDEPEDESPNDDEDGFEDDFEDEDTEDRLHLFDEEPTARPSLFRRLAAFFTRTPALLAEDEPADDGEDWEDDVPEYEDEDFPPEDDASGEDGDLDDVPEYEDEDFPPEDDASGEDGDLDDVPEYEDEDFPPEDDASDEEATKAFPADAFAKESVWDEDEGPAEEGGKKEPKWALLALIAGAAVLLALGVGLGLWYFDPAHSFQRAYDQGDYGKALSVYDQRLSPQESKALPIREQLEAEVEDVRQAYLAGEADADQARSRLAELSVFPFLAEPIQSVLERIQELEDSHAAFLEAQKALEAGDHAAARDFAALVDPEGPDYEAAQALIRQSLDEQCRLILAEADQLLEAGEYEAAFAKLDEGEALVDEEDVFQERRKEFCEKIEETARAEAAALAESGYYSSAIQRLQEAIDFLGDRASKDLPHLQEVYNSYLPVSLLALAVSSTDMTDKDSIHWNENLTDSQGAAHGSSLSMTSGSITYDLNGKYRSLKGTVAFPQNATSTAVAPAARLEIYGDGALIWNSGEVNAAVNPMEMSLNVSKYNKLSFKWVCTGLGLWNDWGHFATLYDPQLQPVPLEEN